MHGVEKVRVQALGKYDRHAQKNSLLTALFCARLCFSLSPTGPSPMKLPVRQRLKWPRFRPGVLGRANPRLAYSKEARMIGATDYYASCLHTLYPTLVSRDGVKCSKTPLHTFAHHLKKLVDIVAPGKLDDPPSDDRIVAFKAWARDYLKNHHKIGARGFFAPTGVFQVSLKKLSAHSAYLDALAADTTDDELALVERVLSSVGKACTRERVLGALDVLMQRSGKGADACGDINIDEAATFCGNNGVSEIRVALVLLTGFRHTEAELRDRIKEFQTCRARLKVLRGDKVTSAVDAKGTCRYQMSHYARLKNAIGTPPEHAGALSVPELKARLEANVAGSGRRQLYSLLDAELVRQGCSDKARDLRASLSPDFTGQSLFNYISGLSQWHAETLSGVMRAYSSQTKSSFEDVSQAGLRSATGSQAAYIRTAAAELFATDLPEGVEPFKWFVEHGTSSMFKTLLLAYARSSTPQPENVKSSLESHNALNRVKAMYRLVKVGLADLIPSSRVSLPSIDALLREVENKRVAADPMVRRTFTVEEIDRMMESCRHDPKLTLYVLLLREVGLRVTAIGHLQYFTLVDEFHEPRTVCRVREKRLSTRSFVTSDRLRAAIRTYHAALRCSLDQSGISDYANVYIFYGRNPHAPAAKLTHERWLTSIAQAAGIKGVRVHPHAFRHTIVGQLIDAGNPMEVVSKYMGHKTVDVTSNHYWVLTTQELHERVNNPMTGAYQRARTEEESLRDALDVARLKKKKCMEVVHAYNVILGRVAQGGGSAADAVRDIMAAMPNLADMLKLIDADDDASESDPEEDAAVDDASDD